MGIREMKSQNGPLALFWEVIHMHDSLGHQSAFWAKFGRFAREAAGNRPFGIE
ncbi:hypothetical protein [Geobacter sp. FeAm09]|uniref:hypothetical protein n=1 Tax=Geobacter sp. FeAm09 TaxID=2597769 RepID=UPI00143D6AC0|nr:hypothetical protein [Geobacter sp. FeAm09]